MNFKQLAPLERDRRVLPRARLCSWVVALLTLLCGCEAAYTSVPNPESMSPIEASAGATTNGAASTWCDVRRLLAAKCSRCHGTPPAHGAPFSLGSYDDTQLLDRHDRPRYLALQQAIEGDAMPPSFIQLDPPVEPLTEGEKALLLAWCADGAPGSPEPCPEP
jgi:uncharacterized membrane protein